MDPPLLLVVGPPGHGVVQYGADLAAAVADLDGRTRTVHAASAAEATILTAGTARMHVHVTDRLFGASPEEAAAVIERWAAVCRLSVTLHDVPQPSDGRMFDRRRAAYARIGEAVDQVVVNSAHEQLLWREHIPSAVPVASIPLGARVGAASRPASVPDRDDRDLEVLLAGFVYPGKGHSGAIMAAADAADSLRRGGHGVGRVVVRAIGSASHGHERDVDDLRERARDRGVDFDLTGFLAEDDFVAALRGPGVPLAAHEHISASRSMLDWVEVGRRPLVVDSRYAREMDTLRPRSIRRYQPDELAAALSEAWLTPASTWLSPGTSLAPTLRDAASGYLAWWRR